MIINLSLEDIFYLAVISVIPIIAVINLWLSYKNKCIEEIYWRNECKKMWDKHDSPYGYRYTVEFTYEDKQKLKELRTNEYIRRKISSKIFDKYDPIELSKREIDGI